ncbi:homoserine O-acetyltransferase MetX [Actinokineospora bangkokensis]|uniref:Homoserine O-acetyltransferase n=1 Tax=Actinokineospora bangkokensis TaxID=1193682 RepID=A0A1Q9LEE7_9PSEU|nr:homoserine O-acetyltransferase [Actinokineospora bangkokensis]OLR90369.1 homoserine O-acetyltransferase [Actinokineospora bangkokensis]
MTPGSPPTATDLPVGTVALAAGGELPAVTVAYETWGEFDGTNAVLVEHALTGDSHAGGDDGWWSGLIGPGRAVDTDRWFVVCANVLGGCRGTTGPASPAPDGRPWGSRFPRVGIRDQVEVEARLADHLGVDAWAAVLGGSMGGMRALEWAVARPDRLRAVLLLACPAAASADQIAWAAPQLAAIRADPSWQGGDYHGTGRTPDAGLGIARRVAHTTYRSGAELAARFARRREPDGRYAVESYLDHHAEKLVGRFDAGSYVVLTEAMNDHDIGHGRGGVAAALRRVRAHAVVAGVDSDRLYPLEQQRELADGIPTAERLHVITSPSGHDGFLTEWTQLAGLVKDVLG